MDVLDTKELPPDMSGCLLIERLRRKQKKFKDAWEIASEMNLTMQALIEMNEDDTVEALDIEIMFNDMIHLYQELADDTFSLKKADPFLTGFITTDDFKQPIDRNGFIVQINQFAQSFDVMHITEIENHELLFKGYNEICDHLLDQVGIWGLSDGMYLLGIVKDQNFLHIAYPKKDVLEFFNSREISQLICENDGFKNYWFSNLLPSICCGEITLHTASDIISGNNRMIHLITNAQSKINGKTGSLINKLSELHEEFMASNIKNNEDGFVTAMLGGIKP